MIDEDINDLSGIFVSHDRVVGTFYTNRQGATFHRAIDCSTLASSSRVYEVSIILADDGSYQRVGNAGDRETRRITLKACTRCHPFEPGLRVEPLGSDDVPCAGRDSEWVFQNTSRPERIYPVQRECVLKCPMLDECYHRFLKELPVYGVMGGVTYTQYLKYGPAALDVVKGRVYEDSESPSREAKT